MSQYERMVSYLYAYRDGEKGANVGYARVENRGDRCRITVQMRAVAAQNPPVVYFYRQEEHGIETLPIGNMGVRGTSLICKVVTDGRNLFSSGKTLDDMDGIYIDIESNVCYSTTWKNDTFYMGDWTKEKGSFLGNMESEESYTEDIADQEKESIVERENKGVVDENVKEGEQRKERAGDTDSDGVLQSEKKEGGDGKIQKEDTIDVEKSELHEKECSNEKLDSSQVQIQSICSACPFKNETYDYGQKILHTFPTMKPFTAGFANMCVRMELKDIGCLPMTLWSLSGNRFLLHGYYCYRHIVFIQLSNGEYVLGVPGIYNEKEKRNASSFGFCDFQSIGEFGKMQGAFGYWLMELPEK